MLLILLINFLKVARETRRWTQAPGLGGALSFPPQKFRSSPLPSVDTLFIALYKQRPCPSSLKESKAMKKPQQWALEIIDYMQKNRVTSIDSARKQIETIVEWVQKDAAPKVIANENSPEPDPPSAA